MKKGVKTALSVAFILLVIGMALIAVALARGDSLQDIWSGAALKLGRVSTGFGDLRDYTVCRDGEESFDPAEVRRIDLGWIGGTVKLEPGGADIRVTERCDKPLAEDQKLCWKLENGTLYLRFCSALRTSMPDKDLALSFPADWLPESVEISVTSADLSLRALQVKGDLTIGATSGDLLLTDCSCGDLDVGSTSGNSDLQGCACRNLTLGSTSGGLRAENCRCDKLEAGSASGNLYVIGSEAKEISLASTSGDVRCEGVSPLCDVSIGTTSGEVRLSLKETSDGQKIAVDTTSGDVYLDVPGAMDLDFDTASGKMSGRMKPGGSGCPKVEIDTTSGDLILGAFD